MSKFSDNLGVFMSNNKLMILICTSLLMISTSVLAENCSLNLVAQDGTASDFKNIIRSLKGINYKFSKEMNAQYSIIRHNSTCHIFSRKSLFKDSCDLMLAELILRNNETGESIYYEGKNESVGAIKATSKKAIAELIKTVPSCSE